MWQIRTTNESNGCSTRLGCGLLLLIISVISWFIALIDGSIGTASTVILSILTIISLLLIYWAKRSNYLLNQSTHIDEQKMADIKNFQDQLKSGEIEKISVTGIKSRLIMRKNEKIIFMLQEIDLIEYTSIDEISGGSGISAMGYSITSAIHSEHKEEMRTLDSGALIITNERIVFEGEKKSSETLLSDILVIEPYSNGIALKSRTRETVQYYHITNPKQCSLSFTCDGRTYEEHINGEWLAAIVEGVVRNRKKNLDKNA